MKGVDTLIKAISQIQQSDILSKCPHNLFIIGGDPNLDRDKTNKEMQRLQDLRSELGVGDLVLFLGRRDQFLAVLLLRSRDACDAIQL